MRKCYAAVVFLCFVLAPWVSSADTTSATVPRLIRVSGILTDLNHAPRVGTFSVRFYIYQLQDGGTPLWSELQSVTTGTDGSYSILLGNTLPDGLPAGVFRTGEARWLAIQVEGEAELPRTQLVSVPYALTAGDAQTLGGVPASAFALASSIPAVPIECYGNIISGTSAPIDQPSPGTPNYVAKYRDSQLLTTSSIIDLTTGVGIAVSNPSERLDLLGRLKLRSQDTATGISFSDANGNGSLFVGQLTNDPASPFGILHGGKWRLTVTQSGNIGIGTEQPTTALEVAGSLKLSASGGIIFPDNTVQSTAAAGTQITAADSSILVAYSGSIATLRVNDKGIGTSSLEDAAVSSAKVADGAISTSKIADGAVTPTKLAPSAVSSQAISDGAISTSKLSDAAITASKLAASSVTTAALADAAVTTGKILDGSITAAKFAPGAIAITGNVAGLVGNSFTGTQVVDVATPDTSAVRAHNASTTGTAYGLRGESDSTAGTAVSGFATATTGTAVGVSGQTQAAAGRGLYGEASATNGTGMGVNGLARGNWGIGVQGEAVGATGSSGSTTYGVYGKTNGDNYSAGVYGINTLATSFGTTYGVYGKSAGSGGVGILGYATSLSGVTVGVFGRSDSPSGHGGMFTNAAANGIVISGYNATKRVFRLDTSGNIFITGTVTTGGADFAETLRAAGNPADFSPGDVLVIDELHDRQVRKASSPYSSSVIGVYSTQPGVLGTPHAMDAPHAGELPVAMIGIVPCKVSAENGPIRRGDLLTTSSTPGFAMKATDPAQMIGAIVGKALQALDSGTGIIEIAVTLR